MLEKMKRQISNIFQQLIADEFCTQCNVGICWKKYIVMLENVGMRVPHETQYANQREAKPFGLRSPVWGSPKASKQSENVG